MRYQVVVTFRTVEEPTPDEFGPEGSIQLNNRTQTFVSEPGEDLVFAMPRKLQGLTFTVDEVIALDK